jgi:hypothetical protein
MKTINIEQAREIFQNHEGTTSIKIRAITSAKDKFYAGKGGSRKKVDRMIDLEGIDPNNIKKEQVSQVLLTSLGYEELVQNIQKLEFKKALKQLEVSESDLQAQFDKEKELRESYEENEFKAGKRTNGLKITNTIVESSKDRHPMLTCYFTTSKPKIRYMYADKDLDIQTLKEYLKPEKEEKSRQEEFGVKKVLITRNFRLENIREFEYEGETYFIQ